MKTISVLGALALVMLAVSSGQSADQGSIPQEALDAMAYRVGQWESVRFTDGVEQPGVSHETTKWERGRFCISVVSSFTENGVDYKISGLIGWDTEQKQLVEHWYMSDGGRATGRYSLGKEPNAWIGTFTWVYGDGRKVEGPSRVDIKAPDECQWNASASEGGKTRTWKTINKRPAKVPPVSNYEKLKGLEFLVGNWEGKRQDGGTFRWTANWTEEKNEIQDIQSATGPGGELEFRMVGLFGWDPANRRITHWGVTEQGKQVAFLWAQQENGKWETWLPGTKYLNIVTIIDKDNWKMEGSGSTTLFKRVVK